MGGEENMVFSDKPRHEVFTAADDGADHTLTALVSIERWMVKGER